MTFKVFNSFLLAFFLKASLYGYHHSITDSTIVFNEVIVRSNRLNDFGIGLTVQKLDSFALLRHRNQSLAELLGGETSISVKSYGPAGLAGISIRGGDTRHTAVLWNGLNLQSPMNASFNFSTVPVGFIDEINIQHGGSGTLFGSGATSGAIHIDNSLKLNESSVAEAGCSIGSFKTYSQIANISFSSKSFATRTRFLHRTGANNFTFINNEKLGHPIDTLKNAAYNGYSFMQQNAYRISKGSIICADFWYQKFAKNIPSEMTDMLPGKDRQTDENFRFSVNSSHSISDFQLFSRFGLLNDKIIYNDALSHSLSIIGEIEGKYLIAKHHKLNFGVNYTYETAYAEGYTDNPYRQRGAIFGSYGLSVLNERIVTVLNYRQESVNSNFVPFIYSINTRIECLPDLFIKSNLSKNYSLPTFNDLFWKSPGAIGNPDLLPESGLSFEGAIKYNHTAGNVHLLNEISVYKSDIDNWIIWLNNDKNIWTPINFENGVSKGLELNSELEAHFSDFTFQFSFMYAHIIAKPLTTNNETESYNGKQMIYVPRNKLSGNIYIGWRSYNLSYLHNYTGQRFTSPDETLNPFNLDEVSISKDLALKNYSLNFFFKIENIMNTAYQLTRSYAMPGRSFLCGLNFKFHSK